MKTYAYLYNGGVVIQGFEDKPSFECFEVTDKLQQQFNTMLKPIINEDFTGFTETATNEEIQAENTKNILLLETEKYIKRTKDGIDAYAKISAEFRLAKLSGQISEEAHSSIEKSLIPVRNEVLAGQWISAKKELELIGSNAIGLQLFERLNNQITNYISLNY